MNIELTGLKPLTTSDYLEGHLFFKQSSSQQEKMLRWLNKAIVTNCDAEQCSILGIGSGAGVVDFPLLQSLSPHFQKLFYRGIDPNPHSCQRFEERLKDWKHNHDIRLELNTLASFQSDMRFDVALIVHVMYYFPDIRIAIQNAMRCLKTGGRLLILHAPDTPINHYNKISTRQLYQHQLWLSSHIEFELQQQSIRYERTRIPARLKITPLFAEGDPMKDILLNFIVYGNTEDLPDWQRNEILCELYKHSYQEEGDFYIDHSIDAIAVIK